MSEGTPIKHDGKTVGWVRGKVFLKVISEYAKGTTEKEEQ